MQMLKLEDLLTSAQENLNVRNTAKLQLMELSTLFMENNKSKRG